MRKALSTVVLALVAAVPAFAQSPELGKVEIKATRVNGNVYVLEGLGGNVGAWVGEDGIVLVDGQLAALGPKIKAALARLSDGRIELLVNTHHHADHTNGNKYFGAEVPIVAHDNVRRRLERDGVEFGEKVPVPKQALPAVTYGDRLSLWRDGEEIRVLHFANGHTDGDSVVFFTRSRVVHMGDDAVVGEFPYVDVEGGGSIKGITAAAERAVKEFPADVKVIPGHGPVTDIDGLKAFVSDLKAITAVVEAAIRSGKTAAQAKRDRLLARWEALSQSSLDTETFIDLLYADLGRSVKGKTTVPGPKARSGEAGPGGS